MTISHRIALDVFCFGTESCSFESHHCVQSTKACVKDVPQLLYCSQGMSLTQSIHVCCQTIFK